VSRTVAAVEGNSRFSTNSMTHNVFGCRLAMALVFVGAMTGCSGNGGSPTTPSANGFEPAAAGADGSTLKATAPELTDPRDRVVVGSLHPTLHISASKGRFVDSGNFAHRFELRDADNNHIADYLVAPGTHQLTVPDTVQMMHGRVYRWRARAEQNGALGPWSPFAEFTTPDPPQSPRGPGSGGGVDATRSIGPAEALAIIKSVHDAYGYDLGTRSSREERYAFLWTAVAVVHFGHPRFNPAGGDRDWCVKDAGNGRQPSDDVIVSCSTREAWDLILSAGLDGYQFHLDYAGRLGGEQNVYPPPPGSLPR
jgi:hypothetical protein